MVIYLVSMKAEIRGASLANGSQSSLETSRRLVKSDEPRTPPARTA